MENHFFGASKGRAAAAAEKIDESIGNSARSVQPSSYQDSTAEELMGDVRESERHISTIGRTLVFKGALNAAEDLMIQGRVEGSIDHTGSRLTIGAQGEVKADISARCVVIQGTMHGDIHASESITIEPSAKVRGNMFAPSIGLKEGAEFKGSIDMDGKPAENRNTKGHGESANTQQGEDQKLSASNVDELLA